MPYTPHTITLQQAFAQQPFSVFSVARVEIGPGESYRQSALHPLFIFTLMGAATVATPNWHEHLDSSTCAHVCAGNELTLNATSENGEETPYCAVIITYVAGHVSSSLLPPVFELCWLYRPRDCANTLLRVSALEELGHDPSLEGRLNQIIGATAFIKGLFEYEEPTDTLPDGMRRARAHIAQHYAEPLTLAELGAIAGLSPKRFSERFNQLFGKRPLAYLIETRMEHATELLSTDLLVKDIARMVGYEDPFYFSRIYKKYCGISPEAARKALHSPAESLANPHPQPPA